MGIINVTPDSFSGDGLGADRLAPLRQAERFIREGADLLDVGGESSRPGAAPVGLDEELDRVLPVVDMLRPLGVPVSVDTYKPAVMEAVLSAGADMINDIRGFREVGALDAVARHDSAALCIMHMQGDPATMQNSPHYQDIYSEVGAFLGARVAAALAAGIARARIAVDPGFGFGKRLEDNLALFRALGPLGRSLGLPLLVGVSRKSMLGAITGKSVEGRGVASVAAAVLAVQRGARIVRVHDVEATRDALAVWSAVSCGSQ